MVKTALAALAFAGAAALSILTPVAANAAPASGCVIDVGEPGDYYYQGVKAGEIEQQFDICPGDWNYHRVMAHWQWSAGFRSNPANAGLWVYVGTGSPFLGNSTYLNTLDSIKNGPDVEAISPLMYNDAKPDEWRAGAELASGGGPTGTGCVEWGSLHYYGNGSEMDVATGGCGSHYWTAPL